MAGTRSSARLSSQQKSSPTQPQESPKSVAGAKRKSEASVSPSAKRGRKSSDKKEQKTIEDTMDVDSSTNDQKDNSDSKEVPQQNQEGQSLGSAQPKDTQENQADAEPEINKTQDSSSKQESDDKQATKKSVTNGHKVDHQSNKKAEKQSAEDTSNMDDTGKIEANHDAQKESEEKAATTSKNNDGEDAIEPHDRDDSTPSSILEKGVIYFFFRGRVGIDNPSNVDDIARSYMVLRPIPHGAKIGEGPIGDGNGKCRLLALPKKVLPVSGKDKFMTFVEKSKTTFEELKEEFMSASDYATQTAGTRHTPPVTPVAEGVYAITTTGRESHLAYIITIPQELGEVQKDMGIREQGSFVTSAKNPKYAGPANTNLPQGPDFPQEILDEFRSLRWAPLQPKFLDYENCQFLLIGESNGLDGATEQQKGDGDPKEELEKLEGEDEIRVKALEGDDAVFTDLGISKKEYPQVPSTW